MKFYKGSVAKEAEERLPSVEGNDEIEEMEWVWLPSKDDIKVKKAHDEALKAALAHPR
ncbi:hypothetical protein JW826_01270 [Candidatus Woesearchaeota archaeon]|nr:hypothetical protein [Candidatus Woesearchaeota archaeon]